MPGAQLAATHRWKGPRSFASPSFEGFATYSTFTLYADWRTNAKHIGAVITRQYDNHAMNAGIIGQFLRCHELTRTA